MIPDEDKKNESKRKTNFEVKTTDHFFPPNIDV
jgi:hypothetical protein